jgi:ribosomal protein S18 acetylase RimI-like enzyme
MQNFTISKLTNQTDAGKTISFLYGPHSFNIDFSIAELNDMALAINKALYKGAPTWIAKDENGNIIGSLTTQVNDYEINSNAYYIVAIAVHKANRKSGIASALMEEADKFFVESKAKYAYLHTGDGDTTAAARALYEKFGYEKAGHIKEYFTSEAGDGMTMYVKYFNLTK